MSAGATIVTVDGALRVLDDPEELRASILAAERLGLQFIHATLVSMRKVDVCMRNIIYVEYPETEE